MSETLRQEILVFYCYAHEDKAIRDELELHLSSLKRRYNLTNWHDREILPGADWEKEIDKHLSIAHLILLLISPHFLASNYCYSKEMKNALDRHKAGACCVIPILVRSAYWEDEPFSHLQMLPTGAKSITRWTDRDEAFEDVARGISRAIKEVLISQKTKKEWFEEGKRFLELKRYEEAIAAYNQAIHLDSNFAVVYYNQGYALGELKRYEEAIAAYNQAIHLDSDFAGAYFGKGYALGELKRYEEAIAAYNQAIRLDPNDTLAYYGKGYVLNKLKRYKEALAAYNQAVRLDPNDTLAYYGKAHALNKLDLYEEALAAYNQAIRLDPNDTLAYYGKGHALDKLDLYEEALLALDEVIRLDPNDALAYYKKGSILNELKRRKEAKHVHETARPLEHENEH